MSSMPRLNEEPLLDGMPDDYDLSFDDFTGDIMNGNAHGGVNCILDVWTSELTESRDVYLSLSFQKMAKLQRSRPSIKNNDNVHFEFDIPEVDHNDRRLVLEQGRESHAVSFTNDKPTSEGAVTTVKKNEHKKSLFKKPVDKATAVKKKSSHKAAVFPKPRVIEVVVDDKNIARWVPRPGYQMDIYTLKNNIANITVRANPFNTPTHPLLGISAITLTKDDRDKIKEAIYGQSGERRKNPEKAFQQLLTYLGLRATKPVKDMHTWTFDVERWNSKGYRLVKGGDAKHPGGKPTIKYIKA